MYLNSLTNQPENRLDKEDLKYLQQCFFFYIFATWDQKLIGMH